MGFKQPKICDFFFVNLVSLFGGLKNPKRNMWTLTAPYTNAQCCNAYICFCGYKYVMWLLWLWLIRAQGWHKCFILPHQLLSSVTFPFLLNLLYIILKVQLFSGTICMWQMTEGFGLLWQVELGRMRQNWLNLPARPSALTCSIPGPSWIHLNLLIYMIKPTLLFNAFLCIMWVRHYDTVSCSIHPCSCPYIAATPPYLLLTPLPVSLASRPISKPTCTSQRNQMGTSVTLSAWQIPTHLIQSGCPPLFKWVGKPDQNLMTLVAIYWQLDS